MKSTTRNWIIGTVVAACVVTAIVVPCVLLIPSDSDAEPTPDTRPTYTFEDLYDSAKFTYSSLYPTWDKTGGKAKLESCFATSEPSNVLVGHNMLVSMTLQKCSSDTTNRKFITRDSSADLIVTRDVTKPDDNIDTLINGEGDGKTTSYVVSADKKFVYYRDNYKKVWRHSYTADFNIFRIVTGNLAGTKMTITGFPTDGMIHHMEWSPTEHILAYVHMWDIYVITDLEEASPTITRVTFDGMQNKIYNGIPDWVYEEEMISANNVLYWEPESTSFAYLKTNDTNTHLIQFSKYNDAQYPETVSIAYPKAGTTNPTVELFVYNITDNTTKELAPQDPWPAQGNFTNYYFSRFTWLNADACMATWTDRPQKQSVGNRCTRDGTSGNWDCTWVVDSTEYVDNGWVGSFGPFNIVFKDGNTHFTIYARPDDDSTDDGRWQIAKVNWSPVPGKVWVTKTNYDIVGLYHYDATNDWLYYTAAAPEPRHRHVYRVKGAGTNVALPQCMTCDLMKDYVDRCGWVTTRFNIDGSVAVVNCRGHKVPMTVYYEIDLSADGAWSAKPTVLYDNAALQKTVDGIKWPTKEFGEFKSAKYEKAYQYEIYKPADFLPTKVYPLLIEVYAGPEFQSVTDVWTRSWAATHMVSDKNIIVASVDGRGSAFEGYKFMREAYLQLGQKEPIDQTDFAAWLAKNSWIDETKIALWGWSYGGYATSHSIGYDGGNTFKCGIAVAPLGDWRWYDSMYAERYMGLPQENDAAYSKASIIEAHDLNHFKKSEYVLIHGTADDNVHFQSAAQMEKALVEADVDFDDFFYADEDHSIRVGANANKHVYRQLTSRISHCLGVCDVPYPGGC